RVRAWAISESQLHGGAILGRLHVCNSGSRCRCPARQRPHHARDGRRAQGRGSQSVRRRRVLRPDRVRQPHRAEARDTQSSYSGADLADEWLAVAGGASASPDPGPATWVDVLFLILGLLLILVAARQWRGRPHGDEEPPTPASRPDSRSLLTSFSSSSHDRRSPPPSSSTSRWAAAPSRSSTSSRPGSPATTR